jgi:hypothetical protein
VYRDDRAAATALLSAHPLRPVSPQLLRLLAHRRARIAAGIGALTGVFVTCFLAANLFFAKYRTPVLEGINELHVLGAFVGSWLASLLCWLGTFILTLDMQLGLPRSRAIGDPLSEIRRRAEEPQQLDAIVERLGLPSLCWLACLVCLLAPLTLHLLFGLLQGWPSAHDCEEAGEWIVTSVLVTWLPHLVLCLLARRFCRRLHTGAGASIWKSASAHVGLSTLSVLPGVLLLALSGAWLHVADWLYPVATIAGVIIFITGMVFVPALYWGLRRIHNRESGA